MPLWLIIGYAIVSVLMILAIVKLFEREKTQYAKSSLFSFISFMLIFLFIWIFKLPVPAYVLFLSMLTVFFSCYFGYYHAMYVRTKVFDRYVHAFGTFSFALLAYCIIRVFLTVGGSRFFQALFIFTAGGTIGAIFELSEALHDTKSGVKYQRGLKDTNIDVLFDLIGSCLSGIFAYYVLI